MIPELRGRLTAACEEWILQPGALTVSFQEPYSPYVPDPWNGVLVLAEAQNHGRKSKDYVAWLRSLDSRGRLDRLQRHQGETVEGAIAIQPWDDGSLPLAVTAAIGVFAGECAVSNAVLWSRVTGSGINDRPSPEFIQRSVRLWRVLLGILQPRLVVTAGAIAEHVIAECDGVVQRLTLKSTSPQYLSRSVSMFNLDDLLTRFPEVAAAVSAHPEWVRKYRANKIVFAAHAVSQARKLGKI